MASSPPKILGQSPKQSNAPATAVSSTNASTANAATSDLKNATSTVVTTDPEDARPLAPPPKPNTVGNSSSDFFPGQAAAGPLNLEHNPFEQSFGGAPADTPSGGTKLPSVAALTSPSSLLAGTGTTPFGWAGGSLRAGPLSPAMLSGPTNTDYFSEPHFKPGFPPTPIESSLRTGLTPGGSGSMFPAPSPNTQALFASLAPAAAATPGTIDFHRSAVAAAAAAKRDLGPPPTSGQSQPQPQPQSPSQSQPQAQPQSHPAAQAQQQQPATTAAMQPPASQQQQQQQQPEVQAGSSSLAKSESNTAPLGSYDPHDNDAANGLYMLAQGAQTRNSQQQQQQQQQLPASQYPAPSELPNHSHPAAVAPTSGKASPRLRPANSSPVDSKGGEGSEPSRSDRGDKPTRAAAKGKGKRVGAASSTTASSTAASNGRRKAEDHPDKGPATKKAKTNSISSTNGISEDMSDDDMNLRDDDDDGSGKSKMTEDEKRKNFLERNRIAALKCRQRKKQWLQSLQHKVEIYSNENDALSAQINALREEVVNLKTLLLAHKDCPVTQQQGLHGAYMAGAAVEQYPPQLAPAPYSMAAPMPTQPVIAGQGVSRRFS